MATLPPTRSSTAARLSRQGPAGPARATGAARLAAPTSGRPAAERHRRRGGEPGPGSPGQAPCPRSAWRCSRPCRPRRQRSRSPSMAWAVMAMIGTCRPVSCLAGAIAAVSLEAVHVGHLHVHEHEVERLLSQDGQRLPAAAGDPDTVAQLLELDAAPTLWLNGLSSTSRMCSDRRGRGCSPSPGGKPRSDPLARGVLPGKHSDRRSALSRSECLTGLVTKAAMPSSRQRDAPRLPVRRATASGRSPAGSGQARWTCSARANPSVPGMPASIKHQAGKAGRAASALTSSSTASSRGPRPRAAERPVRRAWSSRMCRLVALSSTTSTGSLSQPASRSGEPGGGLRRSRPKRAVKWNVLPLPGFALDPDACRPSAPTRCDEMARPRPVPPYLRVVEPSACTNGSKIGSLLLRRDADAGVADARSAGHGHSELGDGVLPFRASVSGIRVTATTTSPWSVNLMALPTRLTRICRSRPGSPTQAVGHVRRRRRRPVPAPSRALARPAASACRRACRAESNGDRVEVELARLDLGEIEDVVDDASAARRPTILTISRYSRCSAASARVQHQVGHADDGVHRRADLVAHVGQELALGPVGGLGRPPWPSAGLLFCRRILRRDCSSRRSTADAAACSCSPPASGRRRWPGRRGRCRRRPRSASS